MAYGRLAYGTGSYGTRVSTGGAPATGIRTSSLSISGFATAVVTPPATFTVHGSYESSWPDPIASRTVTGVAGDGNILLLAVTVGNKADFNGGTADPPNNFSWSNTMGLAGDPTLITYTLNGSATLAIYYYDLPATSSGNITVSLISGSDEMAFLVLDLTLPDKTLLASGVSAIDFASPFRNGSAHNTQSTTSDADLNIAFASAENAIIDRISPTAGGDDLTFIDDSGNVGTGGGKVALYAAYSLVDVDQVTAHLVDGVGSPFSEEASVALLRYDSGSAAATINGIVNISGAATADNINSTVVSSGVLNIIGQSAGSVNGTQIQYGTISESAVASTTISGTREVLGTESITATSSVSVSGEVSRAGAADISGIATSTITGQQLAYAAVPLLGTSTSTTNGVVKHLASTSWSGVASSTIIGGALVSGQSSSNASATTTINGYVEFFGSSAQDASATQSATGVGISAGQVNIQSTASRAIIAVVSRHGTLSISGNATATTIALQNVVGTTNQVGSATVAFNGYASQTGAISVSSSASSIIDAAAVKFSTESISADATQQATGTRVVLGSLSVTSEAYLDWFAKAYKEFSVSTTGEATLNIPVTYVYSGGAINTVGEASVNLIGGGLSDASITISSSATASITGTREQFSTVDETATATAAIIGQHIKNGRLSVAAFAEAYSGSTIESYGVLDIISVGAASSDSYAIRLNNSLSLNGSAAIIAGGRGIKREKLISTRSRKTSKVFHDADSSSKTDQASLGSSNIN